MEAIYDYGKAVKNNKIEMVLRRDRERAWEIQRQ